MKYCFILLNIETLSYFYINIRLNIETFSYFLIQLVISLVSLFLYANCYSTVQETKRINSTHVFDCLIKHFYTLNLVAFHCVFIFN